MAHTHPAAGFETMKLGKAPPKIDARTLRVSDYLGDLGKAPEAVLWADRRYSMLGNDSLGNCTCVAAHQAVQTWQKASGGEVARPRAADILRTYRAFTGYDGTPATDNGSDMLAILRKWRKSGLSTGHRIKAFATIDDDALPLLRQACWLFGGLHLGIALPKFATTAIDWERPRNTATRDNKPYSAGGHAVLMVGYTPTHAILVTWGRRIRASWDFLETYCDEAYACLADEWSAAREAFDRGRFDTDLAAIVSGRSA